MTDSTEMLIDVVGRDRVACGDDVDERFSHDEALTIPAQRPALVVSPITTAEVSAILEIADRFTIPVIARGAGTGLSGAVVPDQTTMVVSLEKMNAIIDIDTVNHVAVVQPGVTLEQLDAALKPCGLEYAVYPGEYSATIGGNVATNAGGMRAVKHGVTRHHVLGLEAVLAGGAVIRSGGRFVKASSGYDLTQLIVGSEGTLAVVTEATLRLRPRPGYTMAVLAPFRDLDTVTRAIPTLVSGGSDPVILEYIDAMAMEATVKDLGIPIGVPPEIRSTALAYLLVVLEGWDEDRIEQDTARLGEQLVTLGAIDAFILPPGIDTELLDAREKAFWLAKANGVDEIVDIVVPRSSIPGFMSTVGDLASEFSAWIAGAGHAGDGNIHLAIFLADPGRRHDLMHRLFGTALSMGGAISAEHGIGREKRGYFLGLEDPAKIELMRRVKSAFDPKGIMNPGTML